MKNHKVHFSSATPEWGTPQALFNELNKEFKFTLDPCATEENAKCKKFFTKEDQGLIQNWNNQNVFCNPPMAQKCLSGLESLPNQKAGLL